MDFGLELASLIGKYEAGLAADWLNSLKAVGTLKSGLVREDDLRDQVRQFTTEFKHAIASGSDTDGRGWSNVKDVLAEISRSRALLGFSPSDTATFIFSFKDPLFSLLRKVPGRSADQLADSIWHANKIVDSLALFTTEVFQKSREEVIQRQQRELLELSTPVVELWTRILALPLIGTLDSERTQIVMERLLQAIVDFGAEIAIIDISGVPTVDTLVAQHLIKTISAARLMGADCIISGIRPQIAQTIVHLGLDLNVVSKSNMADAFALALRRTGQSVGHVAKVSKVETGHRD